VASRWPHGEVSPGWPTATPVNWTLDPGRMDEGNPGRRRGALVVAVRSMSLPDRCSTWNTRRPPLVVLWTTLRSRSTWNTPRRALISALARRWSSVGLGRRVPRGTPAARLSPSGSGPPSWSTHAPCTSGRRQRGGSLAGPTSAPRLFHVERRPRRTPRDPSNAPARHRHRRRHRASARTRARGAPQHVAHRRRPRSSVEPMTAPAAPPRHPRRSREERPCRRDRPRPPPAHDLGRRPGMPSIPWVADQCTRR